MLNADKFKQIFGTYATALWALPENEFLEWLNAEFNPYDLEETIMDRLDKAKQIENIPYDDDMYSYKHGINTATQIICQAFAEERREEKDGQNL